MTDGRQEGAGRPKGEAFRAGGIAAGGRTLATYCRRHPIMATMASIVILSAFFTLFPGVDLAVSHLFYDPQSGFWLRGDPYLRRLRQIGPFLLRFLAVMLVATVFLRLLMPSLKRLVDPRVPLFLLSTLIVGPGLIVNALLKDHWGRPRPVRIEDFGGSFPYVPVWRISDYCDTNCSFVSGEASSATWIVALAVVVPVFLRRPLAAILVALAFPLSLNRIAFGGHFLSDVTLAWAITALVILVAYRFIYEVPPACLRRDALDRAFDRGGAGLRSGLARLGAWFGRRWRDPM